MRDKQKNIELRSDEVQEIMSHVPHWMIQSGISVIFLFLVLLIFLSWFIKYPDVIQGRVTVTTSVPPAKLLSESSGQVDSLFFGEGDFVKKGQIIATIGTDFPLSTREYLSNLILEVNNQIEAEHFFVKFEDDSLNLSAAHTIYNDLKSTVVEYQYFQEANFELVKIASIKRQIENFKALRAISRDQFNTFNKELRNAEKAFAMSKSLYKDSVISKVQFFEAEQEYLNIKNGLETYRKAIIQNLIQENNLDREVSELQEARSKKQTMLLRQIEMGVSTLQNFLDQWSNNYQITAPFDGRLTYLDRLSKNDYVQAKAAIFAVIPKDESINGFVQVSRSGFGKIKIGQKVRIKVDKYPSQEFGQLDAEVFGFSTLANQDSYIVNISLINGLKSSYGTMMEYTPEMSGMADIITEDVRLINRIFNKLRENI